MLKIGQRKSININKIQIKNKQREPCVSFKIPLNRKIKVTMQIRNHGRSQKIDRFRKASNYK